LNAFKRKGICGLKGLCQQKLSCDPFSGTIFAFTNRARTSVKLLVYDASGENNWCYKFTYGRKLF